MSELRPRATLRGVLGRWLAGCWAWSVPERPEAAEVHRWPEAALFQPEALSSASWGDVPAVVQAAVLALLSAREVRPARSAPWGSLAVGMVGTRFAHQNI